MDVMKGGESKTAWARTVKVECPGNPQTSARLRAAWLLFWPFLAKNKIYVAMLPATVVAGLFLFWAAIYVIDNYVFEDAAPSSVNLENPS
jgi:hypothetical protein